MYDPELVSIVIPVFRGHPYLRQAIESALAQTWPSIEVIVVDDGSDDEGATRAIAYSFGDRIRYIGKENGGVGSALNVGISVLRGQYFSWLSHDDRYYPRKIERQMAALKGLSATAVVFSDYDLINENGMFMTRVRATEEFDAARSLWAIFEGRINGCTLLVPRECFEACGMFDPGLPTTQDYALWFQMARRFPFVPVRESLVVHRVHPGQGSRTNRHIEEVNLLWTSLVEGMTEQEFESAGGSATGFLIRALRHLRGGPLVGARQFLETKLLAHLAAENVAVAWVEDAVGEGLEEAVAAVERAGPTVSQVIILNRGSAAEQTIRLRQRRFGRPTIIIQDDHENTVTKLAEIADLITPSYIVVASRHAPLTPESLRLGMESLIMGEIDAWLSDRGVDPVALPGLPPSLLQGVVLRRDPLRRASESHQTVRSVTQLLRFARIGAAPAVSSRQNGAPDSRDQVQSGASRLTLSPSIDRKGLLIIVNETEPRSIQESNRIADLVRKEVNVLFAWGMEGGSVRLASVAAGVEEVAGDLSSGVALLRKWGIARVAVIQTVGTAVRWTGLSVAIGLPIDLVFLADESVEGAKVTESAWANAASLMQQAERVIAVGYEAAQQLARLAPGRPFARGTRREAARLLAGVQALRPALSVNSRWPYRLSAPQSSDHGTLLIVVHAVGGGTIRYAMQVAQLAKRRVDVLFAWGIDKERIFISSVGPNVPEVSFALPDDLSVAVRLLRERNVVRADVVHSIGLEEHLCALIDQLGVPFDVTLVDYHTVAHSPHLMDKNGIYVGDHILRDVSHPMRRQPPTSVFLAWADRRIAISRDTAARFSAMVPELDFLPVRIPEPHNPRGFSVHAPPVKDGEDLRVLLLGIFAPHKGSAMVLEVARKAWLAQAPVTFHVLGGVAVVPEAAAQRNIHFYGGYKLEDLNELICTIRPHVAWMPFSVPETHSFAISDAMLNGLPILTVDLGAVAERLEGRAFTWVLNYEDADSDGYLDWLVGLRREKLNIPAQWPSTTHLPPLKEGFYETDYLVGL